MSKDHVISHPAQPGLEEEVKDEGGREGGIAGSASSVHCKNKRVVLTYLCMYGHPTL